MFLQWPWVLDLRSKSQRRPALRPQHVGMGPPLTLETDTVHFLQEPAEL